MPQVGFESTIPVFERAKTVHALDRSATVIDHKLYIYIYIKMGPEFVPLFRSSYF
jgi:hypothetical protein